MDALQDKLGKLYSSIEGKLARQAGCPTIHRGGKDTNPSPPTFITQTRCGGVFQVLDLQRRSIENVRQGCTETDHDGGRSKALFRESGAKKAVARAASGRDLRQRGGWGGP